MAVSQRLIAAYIEALGVCAIWLHGNEVGPPVSVVIGYASAVATGQPTGVICARQRHAEAIVDLITERTSARKAGAGWALDISVRDAAQLIADAADELGVQLERPADLEARATAVVEKIDMQIAAMRDAGELRNLNAEYRRYREAKTAAREAAMPYPFWFYERKREMVRVLAEATAQTRIIDKS